MSTASAPPPPPARKFPLPCWTHEETLALIEAYRVRWIALSKGCLRAADWDGIASAVAHRCGDVTPPKSSDQCRHKMEKLRQRYRAEIQRSAECSSKFVSAWMFFEVLSFLEDGGSGKSRKRIAEEKADNPLPSGERGELLSVTNLGDRRLTIDLKNFGRIDDEIRNPRSEIRRHIQFPAEQNLEQRMKKYERAVTEIEQNHYNNDVHEQINQFTRSEKMAAANRFSGRNPIFDLDGGFDSVKYQNSNIQAKPDDHAGAGDPLAEMADSIKVLGEGLLKMEKMRMEMALEFEKARMEVELKRNELVFESQRLIVDAFTKASKRKKGNKQVEAGSLDSVV